jgi:hypothetical protein
MQKQGTWTYQLHIISNWIQNERPVVVLMILWSQPRLAIASAPSVDSGRVKRVDSSPVYWG